MTIPIELLISAVEIWHKEKATGLNCYPKIKLGRADREVLWKRTI